MLEAVKATKAGVFMAWKPGRDLLVPVSQQAGPMKAGQSYLVYLYRDPSGSTVGSTRLHRHLSEEAGSLQPGEAVDLIIVGRTRMGFKAVVNGTHLGLLFKDEVFQPLRPGDRVAGFVKSVREDGRINLSLDEVRKTRSSLDELAMRIVEFLQANNGESDLTDNSPPQAIYRQYRVSKNNYKKALGILKRKGRIELGRERIRLL